MRGSLVHCSLFVAPMFKIFSCVCLSVFHSKCRILSMLVVSIFVFTGTCILACVLK